MNNPTPLPPTTTITTTDARAQLNEQFGRWFTYASAMVSPVDETLPVLDTSRSTPVINPVLAEGSYRSLVFLAGTVTSLVRPQGHNCTAADTIAKTDLRIRAITGKPATVLEAILALTFDLITQPSNGRQPANWSSRLAEHLFTAFNEGRQPY